MSELLLPFQFPFMQTAFLIVALISVPTALIAERKSS
jgi:manganese/iron transport system permease protein